MKLFLEDSRFYSLLETLFSSIGTRYVVCMMINLLNRIAESISERDVNAGIYARDITLRVRVSGG